MKYCLRFLFLMLTGVLLLGLTGCSGEKSIVEEIADKNDQLTNEAAEDSEENTESQEVNSTSELNLLDPGIVEESTEDNTELEEPTVTGDPNVDVDLTVLGSNMVYAEVYNMMMNPEDYMGKNIKIKGIYASEYWEDTDMYYHYVIIEDALACCQSGIEFIWDENTHKAPDDYPEVDETIEITGVFSSYEELDVTYYYLATEDITCLDK